MLLAEIFPYAHQVFVGLTVLYFLTILGIIGVVVSENRNPVKSLAWVTVLLLLPVVGMVLYLFFGRSLKSVRMISRRNRQALRSREEFPTIDIDSLPLTTESKQIIRLVGRLGGCHYFPGNSIDVFTAGRDKMQALMRDIAAARSYVHLQYYIFEDDATGRALADLLIEKVRQGVKVRVIYDHVGSFRLNARLFKRMRRAGVEAYPFLKVTFPELANRINWRNHRKIVVIDGRIGYMGGVNIADRYVRATRRGGEAWRDTHLRVVGEAVAGFEYSFAVDWNFTCHQLLGEPTVHYQGVRHDAPDGVQLVRSGPTGKWSNISLVLLKAISGAKSRVYVQTPHFLPNDSLLKALQAAALAHIDVRLMIPRDPDAKILKYASYSYVRECLDAGIKVYFYEPAMLHAKLILVDDEFTTTGSTNFDFRSFEHNFECNALVYSRQFNARMAAVFASDMRQCTRINPGLWHKRPLRHKVYESIVRLMSPVL